MKSNLLQKTIFKFILLAGVWAVSGCGSDDHQALNGQINDSNTNALLLQESSCSDSVTCIKADFRVLPLTGYLSGNTPFQKVIVEVELVSQNDMEIYKMLSCELKRKSSLQDVFTTVLEKSYEGIPSGTWTHPWNDQPDIGPIIDTYGVKQSFINTITGYASDVTNFEYQVSCKVGKNKVEFFSIESESLKVHLPLDPYHVYDTRAPFDYNSIEAPDLSYTYQNGKLNIKSIYNRFFGSPTVFGPGNIGLQDIKNTGLIVSPFDKDQDLVQSWDKEKRVFTKWRSQRFEQRWEETIEVLPGTYSVRAWGIYERHGKKIRKHTDIMIDLK